MRHFFDSTTQLGFGASAAVTLVELSAVFIKHCKTLGIPTDGLVEVRDKKAVLALSACTGAFDAKGLALVTARARLAPEPVIELARTFASDVEGARQFKINPNSNPKPKPNPNSNPDPDPDPEPKPNQAACWWREPTPI